MSLEKLVQFLEQKYSSRIAGHERIEASPGELVPLPPDLPPRLVEALGKSGVDHLYSHQAEAYQTIRAGRDTVLVSRTASGKTLSFLLPILDRYLEDPRRFSVLLLYPTKALSRDQEGTLGRLLEASGAEVRLGTFDGDTPREERSRIRSQADFAITNPDMLHAGILPNHSRGWRTFLSRLRYVVVDEVHSYRGAFGSHVANVFRRLQRVCEMHGSHPTFVCSSATIGNPREHVEALFGRPFEVVDRDGSPRPERELFLLNPPVSRSAGHSLVRRGTSSLTIPLIRQATRLGVRTICFCRSRQQVERLCRAVLDGQPRLQGKVKPYRGGLLPAERRKLERDLAEGRVNTILSTNALELGIDIGDLDFCLLSGFPGSVASFWQQAGRVGRRGSRAVIAYVARDTPIDQYLANHPGFVAQTPIEKAWLDPDNPYVLLQHLPCAAHEHPLREEEPLLGAKVYPAALDQLRSDGTLAEYRGAFRYTGRDYPAKGVNLRGLTDFNVDIYCGTEVIGEIDPIGARGELYKDAIYQHLGRRYMSVELDLEKKLCRVEPVEVDYYTEATWESRLTLTETLERSELFGAPLEFGYLDVNRQPKLYKKIRERSLENIGFGPITLDPFIYDTTGMSLRPPPGWVTAVEGVDKKHLGAALHGLAYLLRRTAPMLCLGDAADIQTDVSLSEVGAERWESALYLYDTVEGGVGYAEKIFEDFPRAVDLCRTILTECPCPAGCPACVTALPPGIEDPELEQLLRESDAARECTRSLLQTLATGEVVLPKVTSWPLEPAPEVVAPEEDPEEKKLASRLSKASSILARKRARSH